MKTIITFIILLSFLKSFAQTPATDPHWYFKWGDEFNIDNFLDPEIWSVANDFDHYGEPQMYRENNVSVHGGNLVIEVKNESYLGHAYTSGWVNSNPVKYVQFGYIEAGITLPYGYGLWPAFWTSSLGNNIKPGEIDIFEMLGHLPPTEFTTNIHSIFDDNNINLGKGIMSSYSNTYHIYAVEWSPSRIIWYIDGNPVRLFANHNIEEYVNIIFNVTIEKDYLPNSNSLEPPTPFPSYMYVDYVRVYKLYEDDCDEFINSSNYDFSTYNNIEKNFIKIGGDGGSNSLNVGDNVVLRASQFVEFTSNFDVPLGASLYADANADCQTNLSTSCTQTFNPCTYDFANYDNSVKKIIELGGNGCNVNITPVNSNISLQATDKIIINPNVIIAPTSGKSVELKIVTCN